MTCPDAASVIVEAAPSSIREAIERYIENARASGRHGKTVWCYASALAWVFASVLDDAPSTLTDEKLRALRDQVWTRTQSRGGKRYSASTLRLQWSVAGTFYRWCSAKGWLAHGAP
jgi:uncharacterized BrkB/YihY/UPF0761 family membrane protein